MDFFAQQDKVRRKTKWLVFYYIMAVVITWLAIYALLAAVFIFGNTKTDYGHEFLFFTPENLALFGGTFLLVAVIIGGGSAYKISELSAGGNYIACLMGGEPVDPNTSDPLERRLVNVVEEMAIASGMRVPGIYIMRQEQGINAFAAGYSTQDAAVCVTRGTLEYLTRDELQGVIGHEFSHILNGDMRFNIRLIGILFGLQMIAIVGWFLLRGAAHSGGSRRSKDSGNAMLVMLVLGLALMVIGSIGVFFCSLIRAAISRQREYLADASAVQYTRNPSGIASALAKIGAVVYGSKLENAHALEAAHMFFTSPLSAFAANLMATHPPLKDRIRAIDPTFDGRFPKKVEKLQSLGGSIFAAETLARQKVMAYEAQASKPGYDFVKKPGKPTTGGGKVAANKVAADLRAAGAGGMTGAAMLESIGQMTAGSISLAATLLNSIPQPLSEQVRTSAGAQALIYALLLDQKPEIRNPQLSLLAKHTNDATVALVMKTALMADTLADELRIPLVETAFPALRQCGRDEYVKFRGVVEALVKCDGKIDIFEYTLQAMLVRDLDVHFKLAARLSTQYYAPKGVEQPFTLVLSLLAHAGHDDPVEISAAFAKAKTAFGFGGQLLPQSECTTQKLDAALRVLAHAAMPVKQKLLQAFTICIWADGKVVPRERELLRAIAAMLGCPMPPLEQVVS